AAPFLVASATTASPAAAASTIHTVEASTINCTSALTAPFAQAQGGGSAPVCANNTWVYDLPATNAPATVRRTETHWGTGNSVVQYREGQTVTHEAVYAGTLGAAGQADNDWHVLWQLHGPFKDGSWPGPALGLNVRNGQLRLGGGAGHPDHSWARRNYEWVRPIATWTDGKPVRVRVQTYLSSDPARGWVSAWVDGRQVLNQWRPTSYSGGLRPGTFYRGMDYVASRDGLYRGTQAGTPPTYRQVMSVQVVRAG
ncbi:MAG: heparin lyase I family protein, partial [Brachybacterium sp.]|nr:heparin lyase I family protein [Brachybacterium sp.]